MQRKEISRILFFLSPTPVFLIRSGLSEYMINAIIYFLEVLSSAQIHKKETSPNVLIPKVSFEKSVSFSDDPPPPPASILNRKVKASSSLLALGQSRPTGGKA